MKKYLLEITEAEAQAIGFALKSKERELLKEIRNDAVQRQLSLTPRRWRSSSRFGSLLAARFQRRAGEPLAGRSMSC
jgi:hypothetical protein